MVVPRLAVERGHLTPVHADDPTAELAPDQLEAVCEPTGIARIIAPAGSGKTRVLTERVRHLHRVGVPLDAMVMVAFNKRAQEEMAERTPDLPGLQIQTLNALALGIVNGRNGFRDRGDPGHHHHRDRRAPRDRRAGLDAPPGQHRPDRGLARRAVDGAARPARPGRGGGRVRR